METQYRRIVEEFVRSLLEIRKEMGSQFPDQENWPPELKGWREETHKYLRALAERMGKSMDEHMDLLSQLFNEMNSAPNGA